MTIYVPYTNTHQKKALENWPNFKIPQHSGQGNQSRDLKLISKYPFKNFFLASGQFCL